MADEKDDLKENGEPGDELSRRKFVTLSVAAGLAIAAGSGPEAQLRVVEKDIQVTTPDGTCDGVFIHPDSGSYPGVLVWPDAFGLRPAMRDIGKRIAAEGYSVLVPNPFYRVAKAPVIADDAPPIICAIHSPHLAEPLARRAADDNVNTVDPHHACEFFGWKLFELLLQDERNLRQVFLENRDPLGVRINCREAAQFGPSPVLSEKGRAQNYDTKTRLS